MLTKVSAPQDPTKYDKDGIRKIRGYTIRKGSPGDLPCSPKYMYPFDMMDVGEYVDIPNKSYSTVRQAASSKRYTFCGHHRPPRKFVVRTTKQLGVQVQRVWRVE